MDEGTFVNIGLMQNPKGDFLFFGQSLREVMEKHTTNDRVIQGIKETIQQKSHDKDEIINSFNDVSVFLFEKGYMYLAKELSKLASSYCTNSKYNEIKFKCLRRIADSFYHIELDEDAIKYYKQALSLAIELANQKAECLCNFNMAQTYYASNKSSDATRHYQRALSLAISTDLHSIKSECRECLKELHVMQN